MNFIERVKRVIDRQFRFGESLDQTIAPHRLGPAERVVFFILAALFVGSGLFILYAVNSQFLVEIPAEGGTITEGIVGTPRFINPVLALSDSDKDLTALVYSGLVRIGADDEIIPDLAESFEISADGLEYRFTLRTDAVFHDGESVMPEDILFTITKIQDPAIKSPKRANWDGVVVTSEGNTIIMTLKRPYSPFIENATIGILPEHIWKDLAAEEFPFSDFNLYAIGSGPFAIDSIARNKNGLPEAIELNRFKKFTLGRPLLQSITMAFYPNEEELAQALESGAVGSAPTLPPEIATGFDDTDTNIETTALPRLFAVFMNQNMAPVFLDASVRKALNTAIPREKIVATSLSGFGQIEYGPIPGYIASTTNIVADYENEILEARTILETAGWSTTTTGMYEKKTKTTTESLRFTISTANTPELKATAEILREAWTAVGADVEVRVYDAGDLQQNVIRPRRFETLLFGTVVPRDADLYAFWHSSQRNDPGLNISMYANQNLDKKLDALRIATSSTERELLYEDIDTIIRTDSPAFFLFSPEFIYAIPENLKGVNIEDVRQPHERFREVYEWHTETDKVWKIFVNQ